MKRALILFVVAALTLGGSVAARADDATATLNALTAEQIVDCLTTMAVLHSGGFERDPIAAPFTHSALTELGAAAAVNILARRFVPVRVLRTVVHVYPVILIGNLKAMSAGPGAGIVSGAPLPGTFAPGHHHAPRP